MKRDRIRLYMLAAMTAVIMILLTLSLIHIYKMENYNTVHNIYIISKE